MLVLGTRYVPVTMLPLAACLGAWMAYQRWRAELPDGYAVARRIDRREALPDQISTAFYFRSSEASRFSRAVADSQYEQAARTATTIRPDSVFPGTVPSTQKTSAILLAAAVLLFGLRAVVQSGLSFEPPLASLLFTSFFGAGPDEPIDSFHAARIDRTTEDEYPGPSEFLDSTAGDRRKTSTELAGEEHDEEMAGSDDLPEVEGLITVPLEESVAEGEVPDSGMPGEEGSETAEEASDIPADPGDDGWSEEAQSLLDKLKQAFQNMLQTLDMASVESSGSEQGQEQGSGNSDESGSPGDIGQSGEPDPEASSETSEASMEGGETGETAGETASAGSTSGEDSSGQQSSGENASAAGTSDGSKDFDEAEQLEVLGKLEALYMERAENMKGEVTIETRLAEQTASVPYIQRSTTHADRGGSMSRDEIPARYRIYIQNYFEALRRTTE